MIDLADKAGSLKDRGYAPLMRFGDRTVTVRDPKNTANDKKGEMLYFGMYESGFERMRAVREGHEAASSRDAFFEECDVLSVHLRLNDATRGIVTADDLGRMKPTALFVNTSRAELVEPNALISALNRGRPGLAAIDVFESEPILQGSALLRLENCICTPHIGYVEKDNYELYFGAAFDNVVNFIKGTPTNIVNPGALQVRR